MSTLRKLAERASLAIPMSSLITVCMVQWLLIPNTGFYLVFDKMLLFYWLIYRPDRLSIFWLCLLYLMPDIKEGWPLGFSSLMTLMFAWTVLLQRHVLLGQAFFFQWAALAFLVALYFLFLYVTYRFIASHELAVMPMIVSGTLGLCLYPLCVRLLAPIQQLVPMYATPED